VAKSDELLARILRGTSDASVPFNDLRNLLGRSAALYAALVDADGPSGRVAKVDTRTHRVEVVVPVVRPRRLAVDAARRRLYIVSFGAAPFVTELRVFDSTTGAVDGQLALADPDTVLVSADGDRLYVAQRWDQAAIAVVDPSTLVVTRRIPFPLGPQERVRATYRLVETHAGGGLVAVSDVSFGDAFLQFPTISGRVIGFDRPGAAPRRGLACRRGSECMRSCRMRSPASMAVGCTCGAAELCSCSIERHAACSASW
jgi:DNA-binding beta-propeller fold protein YncE